MLVYSYIRWSDKSQKDGDSLHRQTAMGDGWLARHPEHQLATMKLRDLVTSRIPGKNLDPKSRGSRSHG